LLSYNLGALAQLGEHLLCKQGVTGSIPVRSTFCLLTPLLIYEWRGVSLWEKECAIVTEIVTDRGLFWLP
jgi:hypothetical protein